MASRAPVACASTAVNDAVSSRSRQLFSYITASEDYAAPKASMLADLIAAAEAIAGIGAHTGRTAPDVVT